MTPQAKRRTAAELARSIRADIQAFERRYEREHAAYAREDPERWWGPRRVIDWLFPKLPFAGWWHKWVTRKEAQK